MERGGIHKVWIAQCEASVAIRVRYGVSSAFDYLVLEKLANFADAATTRPEFARELPAFVAAVRRLFTPEELRGELARHDQKAAAMEVERGDADVDPDDDDDALAESPEAVAARLAQFATIKELLLEQRLGIS